MPNGVDADTGDPRGDDQNWNGLREGVSRASTADDVVVLLALRAWAHESKRTDLSRVCVTGASNGGTMTVAC